MGVANPPYLKEDLEKVCEYAWEACTATHPVRIWSVLPAHCKAMPNMLQCLQDKGGEIVALWPTHSFVFVPLDFWLGRSAFKVSRAMTAPFPVVLAVFENTLAQQLFPVTEEQIHMLQGWTRATLGDRETDTVWGASFVQITDWWKNAQDTAELVDELFKDCQWWTGKGEVPFEDVSP